MHSLVDTNCNLSDFACIFFILTSCMQEATTICPAPCDLLTLKVVSQSRVTLATSVPILVFLGLSVLDLGPMYATDRCQTSDRQMTDSITAMPQPRVWGIINQPWLAEHSIFALKGDGNCNTRFFHSSSMTPKANIIVKIKVAPLACLGGSVG